MKTEPTDPREQASQLIAQAKAHRQRGEWHTAINLYAQAEQLDPQSTAAESRHMLERILDYRCKDYYNH